MIAISYRREDSLPITGRVYDHLEARFGKRNVFMDFASIRPGLDFRQQIKETIERSEIVIAMIGPNWTGEGKGGVRRIDDPEDFVRLEIEYALKRGIPIIPVLINNTPMPEAENLPSEIQPLTFRHALPLDGGLDFRQHAKRLIAAICNSIGAASEKKRMAISSTRSTKKSAVVAKQKRLRWLALAASLVLFATVVATFVRLSHHATESSLAIAEKSIAVLPFENRSEDKANAYFADGIQDEILTRLSKIAD